MSQLDGVEKSLESLVYNLRWAWHSPTSRVLRSLAPEVWDSTHNPLGVIRQIHQNSARLAEHASQIGAAQRDLNAYLNGVGSLASAPRVAYFSAEFAVADCLPIYSGGLGVLAGDHLKAASDLGVPILGVGLLYRYGYFRQSSTRVVISANCTIA